MPDVETFLSWLPALAESLARARGTLAGEAAAHVHLAAATATIPGGSPRYAALPLRNVEALLPAQAAVEGVEPASGPVAEAVRDRLDLFATVVTLADGTRVPVLSREAVLAELLSRGGLAVGLAGAVVGLVREPPLDIDEVREILKAGRQGDKFQPLLELLDVA